MGTEIEHANRTTVLVCALSVLAAAVLILIFKAVRKQLCRERGNPMKILKEQNERSIRLECIGKIDTATAPQFRAALADIDFSGFDGVVLDFENVLYISSAGMSEMAPISITDYEDTLAHICHTVGRPVKDIQVRIFDNDAGRECAVGQVGEIQVQGYNLMTCYYKANLEKQSINADGWMSTGDLGALDADGYIRFVGRLKELIIRGGENIVPNEIISALCEESCISDAKVFGIPDDFFGERVAAAIVLSDPAGFDETALRKSALRHPDPKGSDGAGRFIFCPMRRADALPSRRRSNRGTSIHKARCTARRARPGSPPWRP